jgi:hypothetical protein
MIVRDMDFNPSDYEVTVRLEPEASWTDIAPVLDALQEHSDFVRRAALIRADRSCFRPGAGGPGMDVWTIGVTLVFGALVTELVRDVVYPVLKERLLALYRKVCSAPRAMELKPLGLELNDSGLSAVYRFPPGLSDADFASALGSIVPHFATLRAVRKGVVVLDFNASTGTWDVSEEASAFLTSARPLHGAASNTDLSNGPQSE